MVKCPFCGAKMRIENKAANVADESADYFILRREYRFRCPKCKTVVYHEEKTHMLWDDL